MTDNDAMDTEYLRAATRQEHEATEASVPLMSQQLTREEYVRSLRGFLRAVGMWDAWAETHCPTPLRALLRGRQRSALLRGDLQALGATEPAAHDDKALAQAPWIAHPAQDEADFEAMFLGAMYVVEGSTLGGQYIARHVEEVLHLQPGNGNAYFRGYGEDTGARWREFKATLAGVPDVYTEVVVESAKRMFAFFAAQMLED